MQGNWVISFLSSEAASSGVLLTHCRACFSHQQPDVVSIPFSSDGKHWLETNFWSDVSATKCILKMVIISV